MITQNQKSASEAKTSNQIFMEFLVGENIYLNIFDKYNELSDMFIKYNTALPASAACRALFSIARSCLDYNRLNLSNEKFEAQLLLNVNIFKLNVNHNS